MRVAAQPLVVELWARMTSGSLPDRDAATLVAWGARSAEQAFAQIEDGTGSRMHGRLAHALVRAHDHRLTTDSKRLDLTELGYELARYGVASMFNAAHATGRNRSGMMRWKKLGAPLREALRQANREGLAKDRYDVTVLQVLRDLELITAKGTVTKIGRLALQMGDLEALHDVVVVQYVARTEAPQKITEAIATSSEIVVPRLRTEGLRTDEIEARRAKRKSKAFDELVRAGLNLAGCLDSSGPYRADVRRWTEALDDCVVLGLVEIVQL